MFVKIDIPDLVDRVTMAFTSQWLIIPHMGHVRGHMTVLLIRYIMVHFAVLLLSTCDSVVIYLLILL